MGVEFSVFSAKRSQILIFFCSIGPDAVDPDGRLHIGASFIEVAELAVITAELKLDVGIIRKFLLRLQEDGPAIQEGVMMADGIGQRHPSLGLFWALLVKFLCRFTEFYKASGGAKNAGA